MEDDSQMSILKNKKNLITFCIIAVSIIYFLLKRLSKTSNIVINKADNSQEFKEYLENEKHRNTMGKKSVTININKNFFDNFELLYDILRNLFNLKYEIHLIIKIDDKDSTDKYLSLLNPLIEENVIKKHVSLFIIL
jgi:hypothetical protein